LNCCFGIPTEFTATSHQISKLFFRGISFILFRQARQCDDHSCFLLCFRQSHERSFLPIWVLALIYLPFGLSHSHFQTITNHQQSSTTINSHPFLQISHRFSIPLTTTHQNFLSELIQVHSIWPIPLIARANRSRIASKDGCPAQHQNQACQFHPRT
jgi:hypothetical protein